MTSLRKRLHHFKEEANNAQIIQAEMKLRGGQAKTQRREENDMAIGGMKRPRLSIDKVPGRKKGGYCISAHHRRSA